MKELSLFPLGTDIRETQPCANMQISTGYFVAGLWASDADLERNTVLTRRLLHHEDVLETVYTTLLEELHRVL